MFWFLVLALSPSRLGTGQVTLFGCSPQIHYTSQVPLFTAAHSHFLGTIRVPLFSCPQIRATVQVPSPFYILPPYHPTLTQSPSFPFLSSPRTRRDTPFSEKSPVSRKEKHRFPEHSCSDTPFSREYPVSRTKTTSAAEKTAPKHATPCSDTPFSAK